MLNRVCSARNLCGFGHGPSNARQKIARSRTLGRFSEKVAQAQAPVEGAAAAGSPGAGGPEDSTAPTAPTAGRKTAILLEFMRLNGMRSVCATSLEERPVSAGTALEGKLVVIGDPHNRPSLHADLRDLFRCKSEGDDILIESGMEDTFEGEVRNIDDASAVRRQAAQACAFLDAVQQALDRLAEGHAPLGGGPMPWARLGEVLSQGRELKLPTYFLIEWAIDRIDMEVLKEATVPPQVASALHAIAQADRRHAEVAMECSVSRDRRIGQALREAARRRSNGPDTTFAVLGMGHAERARVQLKSEENILWIELRNLGLSRKQLHTLKPAELRRKLQTIEARQFLMAPPAWAGLRGSGA